MTQDLSRDILEKIQLVDPPKQDAPDGITNAAMDDLNYQRVQIELENQRKSITRIEKSFALSENMTKKIYWLVTGFLVAVFALLIYQSAISPERRLSDWVLMTVLGTTTVNIISLLYLVIKYVFHHRLKISGTEKKDS